MSQVDFQIEITKADGSKKVLSPWFGTCGCPILPRKGELITVDEEPHEVIDVVWNFDVYVVEVVATAVVI